MSAWLIFSAHASAAPTARHPLPPDRRRDRAIASRHFRAAPAAGPAERRALQDLVAHIRSCSRLQQRFANCRRFVSGDVTARGRHFVQHRSPEAADHVGVASLEHLAKAVKIGCPIQLRVARVQPWNVIPEIERPRKKKTSADRRAASRCARAPSGRSRDRRRSRRSPADPPPEFLPGDTIPSANSPRASSANICRARSVCR